MGSCYSTASANTIRLERMRRRQSQQLQQQSSHLVYDDESESTFYTRSSNNNTIRTTTTTSGRQSRENRTGRSTAERSQSTSRVNKEHAQQHHQQSSTMNGQDSCQDEFVLFQCQGAKEEADQENPLSLSAQQMRCFSPTSNDTSTLPDSSDSQDCFQIDPTGHDDHHPRGDDDDSTADPPSSFAPQSSIASSVQSSPSAGSPAVAATQLRAATAVTLSPQHSYLHRQRLNSRNVSVHKAGKEDYFLFGNV